MSMMIPATEARKNFAELLDEAFTKTKSLLIVEKRNYLTFSNEPIRSIVVYYACFSKE